MFGICKIKFLGLSRQNICNQFLRSSLVILTHFICLKSLIKVKVKVRTSHIYKNNYDNYLLVRFILKIKLKRDKPALRKSRVPTILFQNNEFGLRFLIF